MGPRADQASPGGEIGVAVEVMGANQEQAYERFVLSRPESLFYHSTNYQRFLCDLLGCQGHNLLVRRGREVIGALPLMVLETPEGRVYNSLPYYGSNGGLLAPEPQARQALIQAYNQLATNSATLASTVIANPLVGGEETGLRHTHQDWRISQITELFQGADAQQRLLDLISPSARRNIRKARASGVSVDKDPGQLALLEAVHGQNMADMGGGPKPPVFSSSCPGISGQARTSTCGWRGTRTG